MAIEAQFDAGFGAEARYLRIRSLHVDFDTVEITRGKLEIYKDAATRQVYKSAQAAIVALDGSITAAEADFRQAVDDYNALPEADRALGEEAHRLDRMARAEAIEGLKERRLAEVRRRVAHAPGRTIDIPNIAPHVITLGPDGQVLGALYTLLSARFPSAEFA